MTTRYYSVKLGRCLPSDVIESGATRVLALSTPTAAAFSTATSGGVLLNSTTYYYRVSAINAVGETLAFAEQSQATGSGGAGNAHTVTVNWVAVTGATGYKIYGRTTGAEQLIATVGAVTTYIDTGSISPSGALPSANTTKDCSVEFAWVYTTTGMRKLEGERGLSAIRDYLAFADAGSVRRFYGLDIGIDGKTSVTDGTSTGSKAMELQVVWTDGVTKALLEKSIRAIEGYITRDTFAPA